LGLFDADALRYDELACVRAEDGRLRVPGASIRAARLAEDGGSLRWTLEQRVDGVTVARSRTE
jgi:hypothetical protein